MACAITPKSIDKTNNISGPETVTSGLEPINEALDSCENDLNRLMLHWDGVNSYFHIPQWRPKNVIRFLESVMIMEII